MPIKLHRHRIPECEEAHSDRLQKIPFLATNPMNVLKIKLKKFFPSLRNVFLAEVYISRKGVKRKAVLNLHKIERQKNLAEEFCRSRLEKELVL